MSNSIIDVYSASNNDLCDKLIAEGEDPANILGLSRSMLENTYEEVTDEDLYWEDGWFS